MKATMMEKDPQSDSALATSARDEPDSAQTDVDEPPPGEVGAKNAPAPLHRAEALVKARRIAILAAAAGLDKKASNVQIIDVVGKVDYTDFLVLMTGGSDRNVAAIAKGVDADLSLAGHRSVAMEGMSLARWVLIDFVDVVVHVFQEEWRGIYDLDGLWMDAARIPPPASRSGD